MPIGFDIGDVGSPPAAPAPEEPELWTWPDVLARPLMPIIWTRWQTAGDERVCPECGPLDGLVWETGAGPVPPLHVNCRCARVYAYTEWRTRE